MYRDINTSITYLKTIPSLHAFVSLELVIS